MVDLLRPRIRQKSSFNDMELIKNIGLELDNEWEKNDYELSFFPELSASYLEKYKNDLVKIDFNFLNRNIFKNLSCQVYNIVLYSAQKFTIEIIFWNSTWTSIHSHCFCGAFLNLKEERLIVLYKFKEEKEIEARLKKGILKKEEIDIMKIGEVRCIPYGMHKIHRSMCVNGLGLSFRIRTYKVFPTQFYFFSNGIKIASSREQVDKIKKICERLHTFRKESFTATMEILFEELSSYELIYFLSIYNNYTKYKLEHSQLNLLLTKRKYKNEIKEILKELNFEKNIRRKILKVSSYEIKREFALMVSDYCS